MRRGMRSLRTCSTHAHTRARAHTHTRSRARARTDTHTHTHNLCTSWTCVLNWRCVAGMQWLFENNVVDENPADVAQFLRKERSLNRRRIGEYLGGADTFHLDVLTEYVACFDFTGLPFDKALRNFLGSFHVPGEVCIDAKVLHSS